MQMDLGQRLEGKADDSSQGLELFPHIFFHHGREFALELKRIDVLSQPQVSVIVSADPVIDNMGPVLDEGIE